MRFPGPSPKVTPAVLLLLVALLAPVAVGVGTLALQRLDSRIDRPARLHASRVRWRRRRCPDPQPPHPELVPAPRTR